MSISEEPAKGLSAYRRWRYFAERKKRARDVVARRRLDAWITSAIPRLRQEPHNLGLYLSPHLAAPVVDIVLGYVVVPFGSGILWIGHADYRFTCTAPGPLKELGFYASRWNWGFTPVRSGWLAALRPNRVILKGTNDELPAEGDYGSLMDVFTGRFPDVEVRIGVASAQKYPEPNRRDRTVSDFFPRFEQVSLFLTLLSSSLPLFLSALRYDVFPRSRRWTYSTVSSSTVLQHHGNRGNRGSAVSSRQRRGLTDA